jgi:vancomycin permeability regulator SanA
MFFILSKILNYLTMPLAIVCLCFLLHILIRRSNLKRIFFWTGFALLFFFSNAFIANEVMMVWEPDATPYIDMKKRYEYGIVLTGVTSSELTPRDRVYFHKGADRVTHTVQLYKLGIIKKIIVSGGSGRL